MASKQSIMVCDRITDPVHGRQRVLGVAKNGPDSGATEPPVRAEHRSASVSRRERPMRTVIAVLVLFFHISLLWCLAHWGMPTVRATPTVVPFQIITVASALPHRVSTNIAVDLVKIDQFNDTLRVLTSLEPSAVPVGTEKPNTGIIPPHPVEPIGDASAFVRNSGVPTGVHVTVVLRVKVTGSGNLDQVQVEVSGGSALIDKAAIAYVRSIRWIGGRTGDQPASMWVRWGVPINAS